MKHSVCRFDLPVTCSDSAQQWLKNILSFALLGFRTMASLEATFQASKQTLIDKLGSKAIRLSADPMISANDVQRVLVGYLNFKKSSDLWSLVAPPPSGPVQIGWKTPPNAEWLGKTMGLLYDLLLLAPNTKIRSCTISYALKHMLQEKQLSVPCVIQDQNLRSTVQEDVLDKIDVAIRVLLGMVRQVKTSPEVRHRVSRVLGNSDQIKLELLLEKVKLPFQFVDEQEDGEVLNVAMHKSNSEVSLDSAHSGASLSAAPVLDTAELVVSQRADRSKTGLSYAMGVFRKILDDPPNGLNKPEPQSSRPHSNHEMADLALLDAARKFVPQKSSVAVRAKKKTSSSSNETPKKKPASCFKVSPVKSQASASQPSTCKPDARQFRNKWFDSDVYGHCKVEYYTKKSYTRKVNGEGKLESIIGCSTGNHQGVVHRLVQAVAAGQNREELYELRERLMEEM